MLGLRHEFARIEALFHFNIKKEQKFFDFDEGKDTENIGHLDYHSSTNYTFDKKKFS